MQSHKPKYYVSYSKNNSLLTTEHIKVKVIFTDTLASYEILKAAPWQGNSSIE